MNGGDGLESMFGLYSIFMKLDALSMFSVLLFFTMVIIITIRVQLQVFVRNSIIQKEAGRVLDSINRVEYDDVKAAATPENRLVPDGPLAEMPRTSVDSQGNIIAVNRVIDDLDVYVSDTLGSAGVSENATFASQTWGYLGANPATQRINSMLNLGNMNTDKTKMNCKLIAVLRDKVPLVLGASQVVDPANIPPNQTQNYIIREVCELADEPSKYSINTLLSYVTPSNVDAAITKGIGLVVAGYTLRNVILNN